MDKQKIIIGLLVIILILIIGSIATAVGHIARSKTLEFVETQNRNIRLSLEDNYINLAKTLLFMIRRSMIYRLELKDMTATSKDDITKALLGDLNTAQINFINNEVDSIAKNLGVGL
jgi:hypothetical protein